MAGRDDVLVTTQWVAHRLNDPNVRNYAGSRTEWDSMVGIPVEK